MVERIGAMDCIEKNELGRDASHQQAFPFVGTFNLFVDSRRFKPLHLARGEIALHEMDIDFVVDHDMALEIVLRKIENQPSVNSWSRFGTIDETIEQGANDLGWHTVQQAIEILHHAVIEDRLRSAEDEVVIERHIVEEMNLHPHPWWTASYGKAYSQDTGR